MPFSADQLAMLSRLLDEALDLDPDARDAWLDGLTEHFPGSKQALRSMLCGEAAAGRVLETLPKLLPAGDDGLGPPAPVAGTMIGHYCLARQIGRGGMGEVWLAEQTSPVRRAVALKLINAGMYDATVIHRFNAERQSLAMMDHPAIAKVFDAGRTPLGQPYFVMEYVPGVPITEFCDQRRLAVPARLALFIQVCDGVQHAHQKAIIHRDLKPANILVVEVDGRPVPRIIDFGLAKPATPQALVEHEVKTQLGYFIGTPGYMSPEQVNPDGGDVDTRADVYALGVILYVLLTGLLPFETRQGRPPLDEWLHRLRNEDPPSLSAKLRSDRDVAVAAAAARATDRRQLERLLRGDIDCICRKAIDRNRDRRYGTPSELAADLHRYMQHEPVNARPASLSYRVLKYTRRHRLSVSIAAALAGLLIAFSFLQAFELQRTTLERDRATRITNFMTDMFKVTDPSEARGRAVAARDILDKASREIEQGLASDLEVQAQMRQVMATTYANLGMYERAEALARKALEVRRHLHGINDAESLESLSLLGWIKDREGRPAEAERLEQSALEGERGVLGATDKRTLETMDHLSVILQDEGHFTEAEGVARQVLKEAMATQTPTAPLTLQARNHLALALLSQSRYGEAEEEYRQLFETDRRVLGADHPQTLAAMVNLASAIADQGRTAEAEPLYREVLSLQQRILGPEHQYTVLTMDNLASLLTNARRFSEGEALHRQALDIRKRTLGPEHRDTLISQGNLADVLAREGRIREAEQLTRETLSSEARVLGEENPETLETESNLVAILNQSGRYAESEELAARTFASQRRQLGPLHSDTVYTMRELGRAMAYRNRYSEASQLFHDVIAANEVTNQGERWVIWYAFATVAAAARQNDDAFKFLEEAVHRGFRDADGLSQDEELLALRTEPRFQALISTLKTPAHDSQQAAAR